MKPLRLEDLQDLLRGAEFAAWREEHQRVRSALRDAEARAADLEAQVGVMEGHAERVQASAIEALAAVGALEDDAARLAAEAEAAENRSLDGVAAFEAQRERTSELWLRLGGAEAATDARRAKAELSLDVEYRREHARKGALWSEVEGLWARILELSLLIAERGADARRRHREAERLFAEAEDRKQRARQLARERDEARRELAAASAALARVLETARARFACAPGERFLYFARVGDTRGALAVALADDPDSYGAPVTALQVYAVTRERGVAHVTPVRRPQEAP